jgi:hypothetical protein
VVTLSDEEARRRARVKCPGTESPLTDILVEIRDRNQLALPDISRVVDRFLSGSLLRPENRAAARTAVKV